VNPVAASPAEIDLFRSLLSRHSGMDCTRHGAGFLERRLLRRMALTGARSLYEYYRLAAVPGGHELQALVDDVSVHETSFFRNPAHFEALRDEVLPERAARALRRGTRALRLWSAGCSTGQEAWSLAITLFEGLLAHGAWDVQLLASDISARALHHAREGVYDERQLAGVSSEQRRRFFEPCPEGRRVRGFLRRGVEFQLGNVLEPAPGGPFDLIFCRNVMIYFERESQRRLLELLSRALAPGGCLFLGQTEGLAADAELPLELVSTGRALYYRKRP
jgi:chemotaxis protein methyltransferase CheR